jgi:3-hydroxymyristoyl/3-hydroxydecanoyl-(acyl carrier protein) dehydratase
LSWLDSLPHQIPFRAASAVTGRDEKSIEGVFLWTANEIMPPEMMLVEGMAQFAGGLVFAGQGFLTGIDRCELSRPVEAGDRVTVKVTLDAEFGGTYRFSGVATCDGVEIGRGRFYLAGPAHENA